MILQKYYIFLNKYTKEEKKLKVLSHSILIFPKTNIIQNPCPRPEKLFKRPTSEGLRNYLKYPYQMILNTFENPHPKSSKKSVKKSA